MASDSSIRLKWKDEEPLYKEYGKQISNEVENLLKKLAIYGELSYRVKDVGSLIKKLYRKQKHYDEIHDKVGARAIVQFRENLHQLDKEICTHYGERIQKREDKTMTLSEYEFGYQSIHYDIQDSSGKMFCELQIRTVCQHNWSMMSHSLSYKKEKNIPIEIKRQINALSALFEVADTQFQSICNAINMLPESHEISVHSWIETQFFALSSNDYDHEMTNMFINKLSELYTNENVLEKLKEFYDANKEKLHQKISCIDSEIFYSQPEIIIILERLTNKKIFFKSKWQDLYPIELLESIANTWGCSIY